MSDTTKIQWAQHTGGPWLGCSVTSPGCSRCYAMELAKSRLEHIFRHAYRFLIDGSMRPVWGDKATRVLSKGFWNDAKRINAQHAKAGTRGRWFPSMIDWLDEMPAGIIDQDGNKLEPVAVLADFLRLIHECQHLDWLLLTKRPENWADRLEAADALAASKFRDDSQFTEDIWHWRYDGTPLENVWIGTSIEDQQRADERIAHLLKIPAKVRFLSVEPLLGPVDLHKAGATFTDAEGDLTETHLTRMFERGNVDWVICGGESGPKARPCNIEWIRSIVQQCKAAGVAVFVKQLGSKPYCYHSEVAGSFSANCCECFPLAIRDPKGGDMAEWPNDLRIREFPND